MGSTRNPWTFGAVGTGLCLAAALLVSTLTAPAARAEWAIDAYLGAPFPDTEDLGGGNSSEFDGNVTGGGRIGYFVPLVRHFDVGAFIDVSGVFQDIPHFERTGTIPGTTNTITFDAGDIDFNFVPITALVLMRVPLGYTNSFTHGRYQFYGGAGPSLVWSEVNGGIIDDQSLDIGADVRAGFNFLIFPSWGIFTEYRFTYFEPDFNDDTTVSGVAADFKADVDSRTHYVMFGTGLRF